MVQSRKRHGLQRSVWRYNKTVEAFEDNRSAHYRAPTQSLEQDVHDFRALEGQLVAEM